MKIKSIITTYSGAVWDVAYEDIDHESELDSIEVRCVHGFCFCDGKLVVVYNPSKDSWTPPGGGVEPGETINEAVIREVMEESNMRVIKQELIGYQDVSESGITNRQTRSVCLVEPFGEFISDPDGDILKIELIDPADYKKYFDWGEIGDRLMERAMEKIINLK